MKPLFNDRTDKKRALFLLIIYLTIAACLLSGKLLLVRESHLSVFNYSTLIVSSSSMEPEYPVYSLVVIKKVRFENLKKGDVIAFKAKAFKGKLALHRIVLASDSGVYTKGDNNGFGDNQLITKETYVGKAVICISFLARYIAAVKTPFGAICFFVLPIILTGIIYVGLKHLLKATNYENKI